MLKNNSIQRKLSKVIMTIIIALALTTGIVFLITSYNQVTRGFENDATNVINLTSTLINASFSNTQKSLIALKNYLVLPQNIDSDIYYNETLQTFKNVFENASTVFIAKNTGMFYLFPKRFVSDDYDPRIRPWYTIALEEKGRVNWTEPYIDHGTGEFTITASKYVGDNMVVGVDLLLSDITELVKESRIGDHGFVTIINKSGSILATNDSERLAKNWNDIAEMKVKVEAFLGDMSIRDDKYIHHVKTIDNLGLIIIASISLREISSTLIYLFILSMLITLFIIIIAEKFSNTLSRKIVDPIIQLVGVMKLIEKGDYGVKCDFEADNDEVNVLINGFNSMIESVNEKNREIKESEERYKSIFMASEEGLWDLDLSGNVSYLTPGWYEKFGITRSSGKVETWLNLIHPEDRIKVEDKLKSYENGNIDNYRMEYRVLNIDGHYEWIEAVGIARLSDRKFVGMSGSHQNFTARKNYELKIYNMAYKDALTQLYNRRYFEQYFQGTLESGENGVLILLDIDNFKYVNDIYGHSFGDEIIVQLGRRLLEIVKSFEDSIVARFSGNEFIVLIKKSLDYETINRFVDSICRVIEQPFKHNAKTVKLSASLGITRFPDDGIDVEALIQNADIAMYHARRVTKKAFHHYDHEIKQKALGEMQIENHMRSAIYEGEFDVHYQPIISISDQKVKGFESLVRWQSKSMGMIFPDHFIPIAEKNGLINELGAYVLDRSCAFISRINKDRSIPYDVSVNISVIQLMDDMFVDTVLKTINKYDIPKEWIRLEITESIMLESNENIIAKLFYLRNHKIGIVLDDFGTGYSSFKNLIKLPLSGIKIDKAIMKDALSNEHVFTLLESIVDFAHKTNIDVVSEGIESAHYMAICRKLKSDYAQGYYFSRPVAEENLAGVLEALNFSK